MQQELDAVLKDTACQLRGEKQVGSGMDWNALTLSKKEVLRNQHLFFVIFYPI